MKTTITSDYHVHCGQYYEKYYQPASIVKALYNNGIKNAWLSSTTSCIEWSNQEEKEYLIKHINDEIEEAVLMANKLGLNLMPLYWVVPQRHIDGESVECVIKNSHYKGFKIHTKVGEWDKDTPFIRNLFNEVCLCADKYSYPILIHTGVDIVDSPKRFEEYFSNYKNVKFVLAHCKESTTIIELFKKYSNVYGDTAFCPKESYDLISKMGFKDRLQYGTDFPITHWITKNNFNTSEKHLTLCYKKLLNNNKKKVLMEETIIKIYEKQILWLLSDYKISNSEDGVKLLSLNKNAFNEIKNFYIHFIKSYDEKCLDEAINRLLPELRIKVDEELIEDIISLSK